MALLGNKSPPFHTVIFYLFLALLIGLSVFVIVYNIRLENARLFQQADSPPKTITSNVIGRDYAPSIIAADTSD